MNKQGPGKIDWTDWTWNPVTGCLRNCFYCYVKRLRNYDQSPTYHRDRIDEPLNLKRPGKIFVCSTADLFAEWIENRWIRYIMRAVEKSQRHTFQFLTKEPNGYAGWEFPENCWIGFTETGSTKILNKIQPARGARIHFISFEPLMTEVTEPIPDFINWIIIGAMTGGRSYKFKPRLSWIESLVSQADHRGIAVFMKESLRGIWPHILRKEFPPTT